MFIYVERDNMIRASGNRQIGLLTSFQPNTTTGSAASQDCLSGKHVMKKRLGSHYGRPDG